MRRETQTYWNEAQFDKLRARRRASFTAKGPLPWRLLAYLLSLSPEVGGVREVVRKRLMDEPRCKAGDGLLDRMLCRCTMPASWNSILHRKADG